MILILRSSTFTVPLVLVLYRTHLKRLSNHRLGADDVHEAERHEVPPRELHRHRVLLVVREVLRVPVVAEVGGEEHVGMEPPEKGDDAHGCTVHPARLEHVLMPQLVHPIDQEIRLHPVQRARAHAEEQRQRRQRAARSASGYMGGMEVHRKGEPRTEHPEESEGLEGAAHVGGRVESAVGGGVDLCAVPVRGKAGLRVCVCVWV